ncbi:MAG TPA: aminotransferase class III-fold pyridoxal phosphate-dependent enzyme, partial [Arenicellales bacterium]|nr:aminotransferase class III-fold pyridoxal phosphate-dependent enzyme [Arenicellales bacterium]
CPDIVCIAKGLGAGYQPIGAMLCSAQIYQTIEHGSGFFQHGHTYLGHPVAAAAGCAVLQAIISRGLIPRVREMGEKFNRALKAQFDAHPHVGDIRGRGLLRGLEFVQDRETRTPFDPAMGLAGKLKKAAFAEGLICYPMSGTRDGKFGDHVLLAPPFILEDEHIEEIVLKLSVALESCLS